MNQQELKDLFYYDQSTGDFRWRISPSLRVKPWDKAGCIDSQGYIKIVIGKKENMAHRLAWLYVHGKELPHLIDHINGDKTDNRIANLRAANHSSNAWNTGRQRNNTSGFKGVSYCNREKRFLATIRANGPKKFIGYFETAEQAHQAYMQAAKELHGQFARFD